MVMASIEIKLPSAARDYVLDDTTDVMRNALLLYPSIANNTISHGRAAELLGMRKMELIELYGRLGIPYLDMTDEEFDEEIQTSHRKEVFQNMLKRRGQSVYPRDFDYKEALGAAINEKYNLAD